MFQDGDGDLLFNPTDVYHIKSSTDASPYVPMEEDDRLLGELMKSKDNATGKLFFSYFQTYIQPQMPLR
jgi:hypothetical protein